MAENLVIVESPTKARTIKRFLGKDFSVKSCNGHVRDLEKKGLGIDIANNFTPRYIILQEKRSLIKKLKEDIKKSTNVWLASDEDREGEAIAWHLIEVLKLDAAQTKRVVFHEITKNAILNAFKNPRLIDPALVNAQQARRLLDRLIGFEISPILWRKIKPKLSAGRVQSVAVKLIVERENKIKQFTPEVSFRVNAEFETPQYTLKANLKEKLTAKNDVLKFYEECKASTYKIKNVVTQPTYKKPAPPHTTASLQQEASLQLGFSVSNTMRIAQQLYESGHITYMRTDSVNISNLALKKIAEEITSTFGKEYLEVRKFTTKSKSAQEAHEAIRPTNINAENISEDKSQQLLYNLIRRRTLASQMAKARLEKKTITIAVSKSDKSFVAVGERILFDGFLKIFAKKDYKTQNLLPEVKSRESLSLNSMLATQTFSNPPARYNEASLVKKLEELGIGRPSTYAPIIVNIQNRNYVERKTFKGTKKKIQLIEFDGKSISEKEGEITQGAEKRKLVSTDIGLVVTEFLSKHFQEIMNYNFTAQTEKNLDKIAVGENQWKKMLADFYNPFHKTLKKVEDTKGKFRSERYLGDDPDTRQPIYAKIGKYGAMVQIGKSGEDENIKFANLLPNQTIQSITQKEALELFKFPKEIGKYQGKPILIGRSRYGPYIKFDNSYVSIPKKMNMLEVDAQTAISLIEQKATQNQPLKTFDKMPELQIKSGRYGPYISYKNKNYRIKKSIKKKPQDLSLKECLEIVDKVK